MYGKHYDIVLVGAGIMSATLATILHECNPNYQIAIIERLDGLGQENSAPMNNAGTGHSGFCELNYTPEDEHGVIDISKAVCIAEQFELSKQFWASLVDKKIITNASDFITQDPHASIVFGEDNIQFLRKRYEAMIQSPLFATMNYSEDHHQIAQWMPLLVKGRGHDEHIAATHMSIGTDVNFGALTTMMIRHLVEHENVSLFLGKELQNLTQLDDQSRSLEFGSTDVSGEREYITTQFVFLGAGGGALPLLQKSGIPERKHFGGFPVSGKRLVCSNPDIIAEHHAKVYGKAELGAPPMSVPHLDTRIIDGTKTLLFGPYAGFTTKYLKEGSFFDLFASFRVYNIWIMIRAGMKNIPLTQYLITQVLHSHEDRMKILRRYVPTARSEDWVLEEAGYRVQVIKHVPGQGGTLQFGTEIVVSEDKTLATVLGASPGASTATSIMIDIIHQCFPQYVATITELVPSYGRSLDQDPELLQQMRTWTHTVLNISP